MRRGVFRVERRLLKVGYGCWAVIAVGFERLVCSANSQTIRFSLPFFALTCNFCNAWRPKQSNFYNAFFLTTRRMLKRSPAESFLRVIAFFAMRTETSDVQEDFIVIMKQAFSFFAMCPNCALSVQFFTLELQFVHCWKSIFCIAKIAMLWLFFGCILEQCFFAHWNCKKQQCKTERMFWVQGFARIDW